MAHSESSSTVTIPVPSVSGEEAAAATDLVERLVDKYHLSADDTDALFGGMVAIFVRSRMVYGDRQPTVCSLAGCAAGTPEDK
jgi:hypothetical protein